LDNFDKYYIPHSKRETLAYLVRRYPNGHFSEMKAKQLLAIYMRTREKDEREMVGR